MKTITKNNFLNFESLETESIAVHASVEFEDKTPLITVYIQEASKGLFTTSFTTTQIILEKIAKKFNEIAQEVRNKNEEFWGI